MLTGTYYICDLHDIISSSHIVCGDGVRNAHHRHKSIAAASFLVSRFNEQAM